MQHRMSESSPKTSHEQLLKEWLAEFKSLPRSSIPTYSQMVCKKDDVMQAFKAALTSADKETSFQLIQPACHQLFEFYRSGHEELKIFAISLFPATVESYLSLCTALNEGSTQLKLSLGAFLLSVYNMLCAEAANFTSDNSDSESGMEIPNISNHSLYHDPMAYPFSERTLTMPNPSRKFVKLPTPATCTSIIPSNRSKIIYTIMSSYANHVSVVSKLSLSQLCEACLHAGSVGFPWQQMFVKTKRSLDNRRVAMEPDLSIIMLRAVYFALYNGCRSEAVKAVQAMQKRAKYEMCPNVLLLCNAILNSVYHEKAKISGNSPLGLSSAATPMMTRTSSKTLKHAVTAKSIKHHKWKHTNEEVSGDFTDSLLQDASMVKEGSSANFEMEDPSKPAKDKTSPGKILKSKLKKNVPNPSAASPALEKPQTLHLAGSEKKKKRLPGAKSTEHNSDKERSRTPSGGKTTDHHRPIRVPSTSVPSLKQISVEEQNISYERAYDRSNSFSKVGSEEDWSHEPLTTRHSDGSAGDGTSSAKKSKSNKGKNTSTSKNSENLQRSTSLSKFKSESLDAAEVHPLLGGSNDEEHHNSITTKV